MNFEYPHVLRQDAQSHWSRVVDDVNHESKLLN